MSTPDPFSAASRHFTIRLLRPMWIGFAAGMMVVAAVGLWLGIPAWKQQAAIRKIVELQGQVASNDRAPEWLPRWISENFVNTVTLVDLSDIAATDTTMRHVGRLTGIDQLMLENTRVTDMGLSYL